MAVKPIPDKFHTVTPYLITTGAAKVIEFAKQAFGAKEVGVFALPDGSIMHATIQIGDSMVMLSDANDRFPAMPTMLHLYVPSVDATYKQAVAAGGESLREPTDEFYGDRSAGVKDASGNQWWIATHVEDVSDEEVQRRAKKFCQPPA